MAFKDTDIQLEKADYEAFKRLAGNKDFQHWREVVEAFQLKRAFNYISGVELPKDIDHPKEYYRGGYDMYVKMMRIVDTAEDALQALKKDDDGENNSTNSTN